MKKLILIAIISILIACDDENTNLDSTELADNCRYNSQVFDEFIFQLDVEYGSNLNQNGNLESLLMDVYQPEGDTAGARPLVIFAHDGGFYTGDKVRGYEIASYLVKSGYVVASINYRLINEVNPINIILANIDAVHDMRAAVRYFYKDAAGSNNYKIDTNNIFVSGFSAGAFMALNYVFWNNIEELRKFGGDQLVEYVNQRGGISGNSGNAGFSEEITAAINFAGAMVDTSFIADETIPILSVHGNADDVVPFGYGESNNSGVFTYGSEIIHEKMGELGMENELIEINGGDHGDAYLMQENYPSIREFIFRKLK